MLQLDSELFLKLCSVYPVQLDTGSSDLWIKGSSSPLPDTKQTVRLVPVFVSSVSLTAPQTTDYNLTVNLLHPSFPNDMLTLLIVWYRLGVRPCVVCNCRICRVCYLVIPLAVIVLINLRMNISTQAYLDTTQASNPALGYGADGIAGLGFTSLSTIDALVNNSDSSSGRSLLYNMFMQDPSEPNFIAFALERSTDDDADSDDVTGSFSIGASCSLHIL